MSQTTNERGAADGWGVWGALSALAIATVIAVVTFALTSDGEATVQAVGDDSTQIASTTTIAQAEAAAPPSSDGTEGGPPEVAAVEEPPEPEDATNTIDLPAGPATRAGGDAAGFEAGMRSEPFAAATQITNMGPTEVGFTTNFPTVDYTWDRIELAGSGLTEMAWLGILDGQLVAISPTWGPPGDEAQALVTSVSDDGISWERAGSYQTPDNWWISRVVGDGDRVFALAQASEPLSEGGIAVFTSADGVEWSMTDVPLAAEPDQHIYIQNGAAGPAGVLLAITLETYPEEPPRVLVFEGYEVTLDYMRSTFVLVDSSTDEELMSGMLDELFNWGGEGQRIWDPDTGEVITIVPWEIWERAWSGYYGGGSPLPIPIYEPEQAAGPIVSVEYDGYVITVNERDGNFTVADADTGNEIASGSLDDLYQGPAPQFTDPDTGEVYLAVTWDEWYQAEERSWETVEYPEGDYYYRSRTALVTSPDGESWSVEYATDGEGGHVSFVVATADGFIARVNDFSEFGERASTWKMSNGTWSSTDADGTDLWLHSVVDTGSGLIGVGEGSGGPALWSSPDGISWSTEFAIVPQDDGSHAWLTSVAVDDAGTVGALAVKERWGDYRPLVIEQDRYTAFFEDGESLLRVTETGSGELVLSLTWQDFEDDAVADIVTWEDGVTTIELGNGDVMAIPDDEATAAMDELYGGGNEMGISVFFSNGSEWVEAVVAAEGSISGASQLFLADGKIFIGGTYWGAESYYRAPTDEALIVLVGTPSGG